MTHFVVIGLGSIGRRHAGNLRARRPDARFTFVRHQGAGDDLSREFGARVVADVGEVIDDDVDLAVVASPSANHIDTLPALIERGWPLLVEKPIVTDVAGCDRIAALLERSAPAVRAAGFNLRYLPSLRRLHDEVRGGGLGNLARASFIAGQWLPDWRPGTDYRAGYSADAARGGGVELDLSHEFDVARWLFGELAVDFARGDRFTELELRSHDTAVSVLSPRVGGGPLVTVALDYVARRRVRWYEVVGDRARVEWSVDGMLDLITPDGRRDLVAGAADHDVGQTYVTMVDAVLHAVDTGDESGVQPLLDGLASTRLAIEVRDRGGRT